MHQTHTQPNNYAYTRTQCQVRRLLDPYILSGNPKGKKYNFNLALSFFVNCSTVYFELNIEPRGLIGNYWHNQCNSVSSLFMVFIEAWLECDTYLLTWLGQLPKRPSRNWSRAARKAYCRPATSGMAVQYVNVCWYRCHRRCSSCWKV